MYVCGYVSVYVFVCERRGCGDEGGVVGELGGGGILLLNSPDLSEISLSVHSIILSSKCVMSV